METYLIKKLATFEANSQSVNSSVFPSPCDSAPCAGLIHDLLGVWGTGTLKVIEAPVGKVTVSVVGDTSVCWLWVFKLQRDPVEVAIC